jgi:hypothetical protein
MNTNVSFGTDDATLQLIGLLIFFSTLSIDLYSAKEEHCVYVPVSAPVMLVTLSGLLETFNDWGRPCLRDPVQQVPSFEDGSTFSFRNIVLYL